jgi:small redox-active disulfide protein 2
MEIKVLGPGCRKCKQTEEIVNQAVSESGVAAEVIKVTGAMDIAKHGVFVTPAVVVDGEIKGVGKVPTKEEVREWIAKA